MRFEIKLDLTSEDIEDGSIDSLVQQLNEVVEAAVEEKQLEIPEAEIFDYGVTRADPY